MISKNALIIVATLITVAAAYFAYEAVTHHSYIYGLISFFAVALAATAVRSYLKNQRQ
ncbi:hypothetical protein SAMN05216266_14513 [Amycolatopsis marina]|uniref:Uncharacterized protein n=1 Tax=Amycolatopsis marina TaxID=490629 RepID=A0A1I1CR79_9PSEU|nr:hypothetical protein SAMN05216266_14513 [Amycolatopsis marina]